MRRLRAFVAAETSRDDVEFWIADQVMTLTATPIEIPGSAAEAETRLLASQIGEAFCSLQRDDEEARHFATRVLGCVDQISEAGMVMDLLPLIHHHEAFSILVSKHARGLISRAGFRSIVKKRFTFDEVRPWLEEASTEQLAALMASIEASDFRLARSLLSLPAA